MNDLQKRYALDQYDKHVRIVEIAKQIHSSKSPVWKFINNNRMVLPDPEPYNYCTDDSDPYPGTRSFTMKSAQRAADLYMMGYSVPRISDAMNVCISALNHLFKRKMHLHPHPEAEPFEEWIRKQEGLR